MSGLIFAVDTTAAALGLDLDDPGEHAGLLAVCQHLAQAIEAGTAGKDGPSDLRRALNDLRSQVNEHHHGTGSSVVEQLRAV